MKENELQGEEHFVAPMLGSVNVHWSAFINDLQVVASADERHHPIKIYSRGGLGCGASVHKSRYRGIKGVAVGFGEIATIWQHEEPVDIVAKRSQRAILALGRENMEECLVRRQSVHVFGMGRVTVTARQWQAAHRF
jgi:hypothetical protein